MESYTQDNNKIDNRVTMYCSLKQELNCFKRKTKKKLYKYLCEFKLYLCKSRACV